MSDEPEDVTLYIGGVFASNEPAIVRTTLGSCIAVCLFDPMTAVGGMNHYMLPDSSAAVGEPGRYGVHAMELLIGAIQRAGGSRGRLIAKVFGGGHVIDTREHDESVPSRNIAFIQKFLAEEKIHVASLDVGGYLPRNVKFETWTGKAFCKRLSKPAVKELQLEEKMARKAPLADTGGDLELFD